MSTARTHTCVYFDDGEPELGCVCGARALAVDEAPAGLVAFDEMAPGSTPVSSAAA